MAKKKEILGSFEEKDLHKMKIGYLKKKIGKLEQEIEDWKVKFWN